jgi:ComF family protein
MNILRLVTYGLLDVFFPNNCEICGSHLIHSESFICLKCKFNLPYIDRHPQMEIAIQKVFWGRADIQKVYSVYNYQKGTNTQKILQAIKYHNKTKLAIHLGEIMGDHLPKTNLFDCIIPVPLHPKKLKKRGYNQSLLLAQGIQKSINVPINTYILERIKISASQTTFSKYDRFENVRKIFAAKNLDTIENKHILLVDDVLTTGATLEACVAAIHAHINCDISIATLAVRI